MSSVFVNRFFLLVSILTSALCTKSANGQDELLAAEARQSRHDSQLCSIVSLDGKKNKVKIVPDYQNHVLRISCLNDTISINDYWGVPPEMSWLNKNFIMIKYAVRGGSNLGLSNVLILCVCKDKIWEAIHVRQYTHWETGNESSDYNVKLSLTETKQSNFCLNVKVIDWFKSKSTPQENYNYKDQTALNFDVTHHVFYSLKENLSDYYTTSAMGKKFKQKVNGRLPIIVLGKETYYFSQNNWYQSQRSNELYKFR
jgi:hypothetical protein